MLSIMAAGFMVVLERQDRQLELLLEHKSPASPANWSGQQGASSYQASGWDSAC
ncbi:hypothetical protein IQ216_05200 [Cyanobium sp. LEGE 06143]|nr:hypothetical protein [Cyanobium sp. LEGE 06143]